MTSSPAKDGVSQKGSLACLYPCGFVALSSRKLAHSEPKAQTAHVTAILNVQVLCLCVNTKYVTETECKADVCGGYSREWLRVTDDGVGWLAGLSILHCLMKPSTSDGWFGGGLYKAA